MGGKRFADEPKDFGEEREINYKKVAIVILVVVLIAGCIAAAVYFIKFRNTRMPETVNVPLSIFNVLFIQSIEPKRRSATFRGKRI